MALKSLGSRADKIASGPTNTRPSDATVVRGELRYGEDSGHPEIYTGTPGGRTTGWKLIAYVGQPANLPDNVHIRTNRALPPFTYCNDLIIDANLSFTPLAGIVHYNCTGNVTIGANVSFNFANRGVPGTGGGSLNTIAVPGASGNGLSPGTQAINVQSPAAALQTYSSSSGGAGNKDPDSRMDNTSSVGGAGGGSIVISALGDITLGNNVTFNVNGQSSFAGAGAVTKAGGGGGGSGGFIVLQAAQTLTVPGSCSFAADGGNGFEGRGGAHGGGGGGGGYVILGASDGDYNVGAISVSLKGGRPGSGIQSGPRGCGGGGCGGRGGNLNGSFDGTMGQSGQYLPDFLLNH